jgi:hypothetical protein
MTGFATAASGRGRLLLKTPKAKVAQGEQKANIIFAFVSPLSRARVAAGRSEPRPYEDDFLHLNTRMRDNGASGYLS